MTHHLLYLPSYVAAGVLLFEVCVCHNLQTIFSWKTLIILLTMLYHTTGSTSQCLVAACNSQPGHIHPWILAASGSSGWWWWSGGRKLWWEHWLQWWKYKWRWRWQYLYRVPSYSTLRGWACPPGSKTPQWCFCQCWSANYWSQP